MGNGMIKRTIILCPRRMAQGGVAQLNVLWIQVNLTAMFTYQRSTQ
jgi:hypothetical protein